MTMTRQAQQAHSPESDAPNGGQPAAGTLARRLAGWLAGWRVSLRMARREILKHRGRSLLVAVMVCLPVVVMIGGLTVLATGEITVRESIPARMGSAQAVLAGQTPSVVASGDPLTTRMMVRCETGTSSVTVDGSWGIRQYLPPCDDRLVKVEPPPPAAPIPGLSRTATLSTAMTALGAVVGGRLVPAAWHGIEVYLGQGTTSLDVLAVDGADPAVRGMVDLTSGRWPAKPGEYVVTDAGERLGLPGSGTFEFIPPIVDPVTGPQPTAAPTPVALATPTPSTVVSTPPTAPARASGTIVGTARAAASDRPVQLVGLPPTELAGTQFLLDRTTPVTWADVTRLNGYGITLLSRDVVEHPDQVPSTTTSEADVSRSLDLTAVTLLCLALLVESCLLAGPAFAVIAQRQRYPLALAAANGATRSQLRRTLLAHALVLGVLAAVVGLALGMVGAFIALPFFVHWTHTSIGPFDVPLLESSIVVGCAILAAVVSALIPARGLTRLDVVAALRGDIVSRRPHRGVPVFGAVMFAGGAAALGTAAVYVASLSQYPAPVLVSILVVGGLGLVIGALCLVPSILAHLGRLTAGLPVPVRLATRDAARQRGKAIPTVAAIMAGSILLAGFGIAGTTLDAQLRAEYQPRAPMGTATFFGVPSTEIATVRTAVADSAPGATLHEIGRMALPAGQAVEPEPDAIEGSMRNAPTLIFGSARCTPAQVVDRTTSMAPVDQELCPSIVVSSITGSGAEVVLSAQDLTALYGLDPRARETLDAGGVIVNDALLAPGGRLTVIEGTANQDPMSIAWHKETGRREVAAYVAPSLFTDYGGMPQVALTPQTAAALGATVAPSHQIVSSPTGEVT